MIRMNVKGTKLSLASLKIFNKHDPVSARCRVPHATWLKAAVSLKNFVFRTLLYLFCGFQ